MSVDGFSISSPTVFPTTAVVATFTATKNLAGGGDRRRRRGRYRGITGIWSSQGGGADQGVSAVEETAVVGVFVEQYATRHEIGIAVADGAHLQRAERDPGRRVGVVGGEDKFHDLDIRGALELLRIQDDARSRSTSPSRHRRVSGCHGP